MKKMLIVIILLLIVLIFLGKNIYEKSLLKSNPTIWEKRIEAALAPVECIDVIKPNFGQTYQGTLIDTHYHIANIPDDPISEVYSNTEKPLLGVNIKIGNIICSLEKENTTKVFAFFPVYKEISEPMVKLVENTLSKYPDKFIPFIMPPDRDDSPEGFPTVDSITLNEMLNIKPGLFKGYGEIGLYERGDHGGPKGAPELPPDSQRLKEIYPLIRENKLIVYVHLGEGQKESFMRTLKDNPDINFIWHGDQLIKYEKGAQNLEALDEILYNNPNAYYGIDELYGDVWLLRPEISKEEFFTHFNNYEKILEKDLVTWKEFIENHPDQVLWGTDRGWSAPWSSDEDVGIVLATYSRAFIAKLNPDVQEKFAHKNAEKLLN